MPDLPATVNRYPLTLRFAIVCLASIVLTAVASATWMAHGVATRMVQHNGELASEFVNTLMQIHGGAAFFIKPDAERMAALAPVFNGLADMPDLVHANAYDRERRVIWSTRRDAIGAKPGANHELDEALDGELAIESPLLSTAHFVKPEHVFLPDGSEEALEIYIPVRAGAKKVVGVVELYMSPARLRASIRELTQWVWLTTFAAGLVLFGVLLGLVRRADRLIASQQREIASQETMAAVGHMAAAVAHGIRNPMASIRSSAELMQGGPEDAAARDIVAEVDRLEGWVRKLLAYAREGRGEPSRVEIASLLQGLVSSRERHLRARRIEAKVQLADHLPPVLADAAALEQAFDNLVSNAVEAMPDGGTLVLAAAPASGNATRAPAVQVTVRDSGIGMTPVQRERMFVPFHTTKRTGLGVGLAMVRRTLDRLGATITVDSAPGAGTCFTIVLPATRP